ncbi:hypothetical protein B7453_09720 [Pseudomonas sp. IB20]|uniref:hypothetical protein n=1 Tax=Pseudomonas TaxID=286 RepID=UPI000BA088B8|nr:MULTISPECIES: hypothetical protein [unclassified Pseudomonas]MCV2227218.1 hypothetical protein [Pseudomonas sp. AU10]OZO04719.1 hypothetical protein B7453_09720 [Pseudomonas sp. IB20]
MNTAFANLYQSVFTPTESERRLAAAAEQYVAETEAYDRTVCTGTIVKGSIMPADSQERGLVNRNALRAMDRLCTQHPEFTRQQILREVTLADIRGPSS